MKRIYFYSIIVILTLCIFLGYTYCRQNKTASHLPTTAQAQVVEAHRSIILGDNQKADQLYKSALKQESNLLYLQDYLLFLITQNNLKESYPIAQQILQFEPTHLLANLIKSAYLIKHSNATKAYKAVDAASKGWANIPGISTVVAALTIMAEPKTLEEANPYVQQVSRDYPDFYERQKLLHHLLASQYSQALPEAHRLSQQYPDITNVLQYCKLLVLEGKNKPQAIKVFKRFISPYLSAASNLSEEQILQYLENYDFKKIDQSYVFAKTLLYFTNRYLSYTSAAPYIEPDNILITHIAYMLAPEDNEAKVKLAEYYSSKGNYRVSIDMLNRIPTSSVYYRLIYSSLATTLVELGQPKHAIQVYMSAIKDNPTSFEPLLELAHLYYKQQHYGQAMDYYNQALKVAQQNRSDLGKWLAYYFRGIAYNKQGDWQKALVNLNQAYQIKKSDPLLQNYLGYLLIIHKVDLIKGEHLVREALNQQPNNPAFLDSYAWVLFLNKKYSQAHKIINKALKLDNNRVNFSLLEHSGDIQWALGHKGEAYASWRRAMNLADDPQEKTKLSAKIKGTLPQYSQDAEPNHHLRSSQT